MKRWPELTAITALVATLVGAVLAQESPAPNAKAAPVAADSAVNTFAIRGARVFDGERDLGIATVVVRDGRIAAVGSTARIDSGMSVIDGTGKTLLPGLIDAHVHAWGEAQRDMARFGVTGGFDMHGVAERLPALRTQRESYEASGQADLWAAGTAVTAPGGHGTQYGFPVPTVDADTDVDAFIGERVDAGADFIKLIVEDLSAYGMPRRLPTLSAPQVRAVVEAAHARKRLAVAHVAKRDDARMAVDAGADGLVHVFTDAVADDALVAAMHGRKAFVVPTLTVVASMAGSGEGKALAADARIAPQLGTGQTGTLARDFIETAEPARLQRALDSVRRLHAAGVDVLAGSDAPNPGTAHGASLHHELALLVRAGLTPAQALRAATALPAKRFGIADRGRIAPGQRADLLLVQGDPLRDIADTRAIDAVWKNGHRVERDVRAAAPPAAAPPGATASTPLPISSFDGDAIDAAFGSWQATTDQMAGGKSEVRHALVAGGAGDSRGALEVTGVVKPGFAYPWSGVIFFPASAPMQPADLSARSELVFHARGDGRSYSVLLFSGASAQGMPAMQSFTAGPQWKEVRIPLSGFAGADLAQVRGIAFTAGQPHGTFAFRIDGVELR